MTAATDPRVTAVMPTAGALIAAVAVQDADKIQQLIRDCPDQEALIVVLAAQAALPATMPAGTAAALTVDERRAAHASYIRGERDALTVFGEREYQREHKRAKKRRELALAAWNGPVEPESRHAENSVESRERRVCESRVGSSGAAAEATPPEPAHSFETNERN
jgi:hypothetical protein